LDCRRDECNKRVIHFRRITGTDRFTIIQDEEVEDKMPKGVKAVINMDPETGRRQVFSLVVKYGLTGSDMAMVAAQIEQVERLLDKWHATEGEMLIGMLPGRAGRTLIELAEQSSAQAWAEVAGEFERQFPGYTAELVKGKVRVQEV